MKSFRPSIFKWEDSSAGPTITQTTLGLLVNVLFSVVKVGHLSHSFTTQLDHMAKHYHTTWNDMCARAETHAHISVSYSIC